MYVGLDTRTNKIVFGKQYNNGAFFNDKGVTNIVDKDQVYKVNYPISKCSKDSDGIYTENTIFERQSWGN